MKKKALITLLCVMIAATLGVGMATASASAFDTTIDDWGIEYFNQLDYGIYWYADPDNPVPTSDYTVDKTKPTILYTHGWKPDESAVREGLSLKDGTVAGLKKQKFAAYPYETEFYKYYIEQGYNVGVFYWNQLVDNGAKDFGVDRRIWMSEGGTIMRYRTYASKGAKPNYTEADDPTNPKKSVALLYADELIKYLGTDYDQPLHLTGHSMGGQLTSAVTEALCLMCDEGKIPASFLPERVTLLDPYIDGFNGLSGTVDHLGITYDSVYISQLVAHATTTIREHGIPIEAYSANPEMVTKNYYSMGWMTKWLFTKITDENRAEYEAWEQACADVTATLAKNCAWVVIDGLSSVFGTFSPSHVMAVDYYFTTNNFSTVRQSEEGVDVPCARMSTEDLQKVVGLAFRQTVQKKQNPLYYTEGVFNVVDYCTDSFEPLGEDSARITGVLDAQNRNGQKITAVAYDEEGEQAATANVDAKGYYYLSGLKEGSYVVKFFAGNSKNAFAETEAIETTGTVKPAYPDVLTAEVPASTDKMLLVIILGLCLVMVVVTVAALVVAIRNNKRRKGVYKQI